MKGYSVDIRIGRSLGRYRLRGGVFWGVVGWCRIRRHTVGDVVYGRCRCRVWGDVWRILRGDNLELTSGVTEAISSFSLKTVDA